MEILFEIVHRKHAILAFIQGGLFPEIVQSGLEEVIGKYRILLLLFECEERKVINGSKIDNPLQKY